MAVDLEPLAEVADLVAPGKQAIPETGGREPLAMTNLGELYGFLGQYAKGEPFASCRCGDAARLRGTAHPAPLNATGQLTHIRLAQHKHIEAERLARPLVDARRHAAPNGWPRLVAESQLGPALAGQHRFEGAEPLLLTNYEAMVQRKNTPAFYPDPTPLDTAD